MLPFIIKEKDPLSNLFRAILWKDIVEKYWKLCDRELIQKRKNWLSWRAQLNVLIKQNFVIGYYIKVNARLTSETGVYRPVHRPICRCSIKGWSIKYVRSDLLILDLPLPSSLIFAFNLHPPPPLSGNIESKHQEEPWRLRLRFLTVQGRWEWIILTVWIAHILFIFCKEPGKKKL